MILYLFYIDFKCFPFLRKHGNGIYGCAKYFGSKINQLKKPDYIVPDKYYCDYYNKYIIENSKLVCYTKHETIKNI